jgi:hypothetical protein
MSTDFVLDLKFDIEHYVEIKLIGSLGWHFSMRLGQHVNVNKEKQAIVDLINLHFSVHLISLSNVN